MNGIVVIDKPPGKTSHDVVIDVKKTLGAKKAGHTGTLDPLATGVLPVCINEATKLAPFFSQDTKEYLVTMLLGVKTDTQDVEGRIIASVEPSPIDLSEVKNVTDRFVGKIAQTPPRYSAIKFRGKALYKWARYGIHVDMHPRVIEIYHIDIQTVRTPYVMFKVSCSKGTYIRSLCADIGDGLGCGACLSELRRIRTGRFVEDAAVSLQKVDVNNLISMVDALPDFPFVPVGHAFADKLRTGYQPAMGTFDLRHMPFINAGDMIMLTDERRHLVAIARMLYSSDQFGELDEKVQVMKLLRVFRSES